MKDALGHGSNAGAHAGGITSLPRNVGRYRVEKQSGKLARTAAGQVNRTVGAVWERVAAPKRRAVAERIAQLARIDNPDHRVRVR